MTGKGCEIARKADLCVVEARIVVTDYDVAEQKNTGTATELIKRLVWLVAVHGDLPVYDASRDLVDYAWVHEGETENRFPRCIHVG